MPVCELSGGKLEKAVIKDLVSEQPFSKNCENVAQIHAQNRN